MGNRAHLGKVIAGGLIVAVLTIALVLFTPSLRSLVRTLPWRLYHYYVVMPPPKNAAEVGDGKDALEILLQDPMGIGEDHLGNVYISDRGRRIWKVDREHRAQIIAGTGRRGRPTTDADALASDLGRPEGLCVDSLGRIYFADSYNHMVLRIETDGRLNRVAGTGTRGYGGDGGPADKALLNKPYDVRLDSEGNLYIADFGNHRIRKVDDDGVIHTVAGTGEPGYSGDHGLATAAQLNGPYGIFATADNRLLIADTDNHVIREVDENGVIRTIAGVGHPGYSGDGGPAVRAMLNAPQSLYVDDSGRIYVGDEHNHAVRVIRADKTIFTLIGNGVPDFSGDGLPAERAQLNDPENLLFRSDGTLLITDGDNARLREVTADGIVKTFAGH